MANMNAEAVQFEIERLQECCIQYRDDIKILSDEIVGLCKIIDYAKTGILEQGVIDEVSRRVEHLATCMEAYVRP